MSENIKDGLDNSEFAILYDLMAIFTVCHILLHHWKNYFAVVNHVKTKTNLLKPRLLWQMQKKHCQEASKAATI